jgi:phosphoribosylformylglycinamidine synthase I
LIRNRELHFVCEHVNVRVESTDTPFTHELRRGQVLKMPVAHAEGNYVCDDATFEALNRDNRVIFRYSDREGRVSQEANINGSRDNIAGICSRGRNVMGLMPHPERACEDALGSSDGRAIFHSLVGAVTAIAA